MDTPKYTPPLDPKLAALVDALDADALEFFQERSAIRTFEGRQPCQAAEAAAWEETLRYIEQRNARAMANPDRQKVQK